MNFEMSKGVQHVAFGILWPDAALIKIEKNHLIHQYTCTGKA